MKKNEFWQIFVYSSEGEFRDVLTFTSWDVYLCVGLGLHRKGFRVISQHYVNGEPMLDF